MTATMLAMLLLVLLFLVLELLLEGFHCLIVLSVWGEIIILVWVKD